MIITAISSSIFMHYKILHIIIITKLLQNICKNIAQYLTEVVKNLDSALNKYTMISLMKSIYVLYIDSSFSLKSYLELS